MLKRPSSRRKSHKEPVMVNLIPMMDALVVLIIFLVYTMSLLNLVSIESPVPMASSDLNQQKLTEKPLQLTLSINQNFVEIWSPFEKIKTEKIDHLPDGSPDVVQIHEKLLQVKQQFLTEEQIIIVPFATMTYDALVMIIDAVRTIDDTDTPIFVQDATTGVQTETKGLFPKIVFGNLLGDT